MCHLSCTHTFLSKPYPHRKKRRSTGADEGIAELYIMNIFLIVGDLCKQSREVLLSSRYCRHSKLTELVSDSATSLPDTLNEKKFLSFCCWRWSCWTSQILHLCRSPWQKQLSNASHRSWRHQQYTQASTWLLEVACWKYVKSIWKKYFEWSIWTNTSTDKKYFKYVFEIQVFQILPTSDCTSGTLCVLYLRAERRSATVNIAQVYARTSFFRPD